jgi:hypothetical protein
VILPASVPVEVRAVEEPDVRSPRQAHPRYVAPPPIADVVVKEVRPRRSLGRTNGRSPARRTVAVGWSRCGRAGGQVVHGRLHHAPADAAGVGVGRHLALALLPGVHEVAVVAQRLGEVAYVGLEENGSSPLEGLPEKGWLS